MGGDRNVTSLSLRNTVLNQTSLAALFYNGIDDINGTVVEMDLSGIDFAKVTDPRSLFEMEALTSL